MGGKQVKWQEMRTAWGWRIFRNVRCAETLRTLHTGASYARHAGHKGGLGMSGKRGSGLGTGQCQPHVALRTVLSHQKAAVEPRCGNTVAYYREGGSERAGLDPFRTVHDWCETTSIRGRVARCRAVEGNFFTKTSAASHYLGQPEERSLQVLTWKLQIDLGRPPFPVVSTDG